MTPLLRTQSIAGTPDGDDLITVRMSAGAARELAKACREAHNAVLDELEVDGRKPRQRELHMMEWLDWGSRWLVFDDAREVVGKVGPDGEPE